MPGYVAATEVYYVKQGDSMSSSNRLAPAPMITISPEIYFANDNPIGYTYKITLKGYANALRKELDAGSTDYGIGPVIQHMGNIRDIFNCNGGDLHVVQTSGDIILAKGATIKNIKFDQPDSTQWINYVPFTIELEFNEVDYGNCDGTETIPCNSSIFHQIIGSKNINDALIDITDYKIKAFNDKWTITLDERIHQAANSHFMVSYTISATGKHYYIEGKLVPAWQQAKLFSQYRLRSQVINLINGILPIDSDDACSSTKDITEIHTLEQSDGGLDNFNTLRDNSLSWDVYNEYITCETSESDGVFSLTYNATIKKGSTINPSANAVLHSYTKDLNTSSSDKLDATLTVKGTIQGLVRGGFIYYDFNDFQLPATGSLLTAKDGFESKYGNAYAHFTSVIGNNNDLSDSFKLQLGITKTALLIKNDDGRPPQPSSFTIDHGYTDGVLTYNAVYNRANTVSKLYGFTNISIVRKDPVEIIQEFVIPGRSSGPIIQKLNMKKPRTISINIDGASKDNKACSLQDLCDSLPITNIQGLDKLLTERDDMIKTKEEYTSNIIDGSFSISLEYIVKG